MIQFGRVLRLALFHGALPSEVYAFRLYRAEKATAVWDYVFTHEVSAFHTWRSSKRSGDINASQTLGDKHLTAQLLQKHGVPMVSDLKIIPRGEEFEVSSCLKAYPKLFCKPGKGSAGRGCFVIDGSHTKGAPIVYKTGSGAVTERSSWACLQKAAALDDYLIQPFIENHPVLSRLSETDDAITVRIITEIDELETVRVYSAVLEAPVLPQIGADPGETGMSYKAPFHAIIPLDGSSGKLIRLPEKKAHPLTAKYDEPVYLKMGQDPLPFWNQMKAYAWYLTLYFRMCTLLPGILWSRRMVLSCWREIPDGEPECPRSLKGGAVIG